MVGAPLNVDVMPIQIGDRFECFVQCVSTRGRNALDDSTNRRGIVGVDSSA